MREHTINAVKIDRHTLADWHTFTPMFGKGHHGKKTAILVERDDPAELIGHIIIPDAFRTVPHRGLVRRVAKEVREVQEGDMIRFSARGRPEVTIGGKLFSLIVEEDVYGVEPNEHLPPS